MYTYNKPNRTGLRINKGFEGESIEEKVERITVQKEPIKDGAPLIYTERKNGVQAGHNIRTDRFEVAIDAMDYVTKSAIAKREGVIKLTPNDIKDDSIEGTNK